MNKKLSSADADHQFSFRSLVEKVEQVDNRAVFHYDKHYIRGKTVQSEIFDGIWIIYHDLTLQTPEVFPMEETGFIRMNYCISGRCEMDYKNHKVFYIGSGDFIAALLGDKHHKHIFPLGNYEGISIVTTETKLDGFLKTIFMDTQITSSVLIQKMKQCGKFMLLSNRYKIKEIMSKMIILNDTFWKEKTVLKFAELVILLIDDDMEAMESKEKYFERHLTDKVKQIKKEVTENMEEHLTIKEVAEKHHISSRAFSECFKEIYGKTYYAFIKEFRIKKAADMLRSTNNSVTEIAITVGYQNASKFSKAFSDIVGVTPICYRKNNSSAALE
ncbi:AraC family transcriptional regulator [Desulfoscipio sp. XC116]|uniref:helix-turn-helix domain-containing protein n=1 Tax=Desulfoscipio sp. XC116 TaxID=3144975 RepID=UPI00325B7DA2